MRTFSPTLLSILSKCGLQAYFKYVLGLRPPTRMPMHVGRVVHASQERALRCYVAGDFLPFDDVADYAADLFERGWSEVELEPDERVKRATVRGRAKDHAISASRSLHAELTPRMEVESAADVELPLRVAVKGTDLALVGRLDVFERRAKRVTDFKVPIVDPGPDSPSCSPQLDFYALALSRMGEDVRELGIAATVKRADGSSDFKSYSAAASIDHEPILRRISMAAKVFETGSFYPADPSGPSGWVCRGCYLRERCPVGGANRRTFAAGGNGS